MIFIINQNISPRNNEKTKKELEEHTHQVEYKIYPIVIEWFAEDIIEFRDGDFYLKGELISVPIVYQVNDSHD